MIGPFDSEREARTAAHQIVAPAPGSCILSEDRNIEMLGTVCRNAGVELGRYDMRIISWLAGFTDANCGVIAGLICRAHEAGKRHGQRGVAERSEL